MPQQQKCCVNCSTKRELVTNVHSTHQKTDPKLLKELKQNAVRAAAPENQRQISQTSVSESVPAAWAPAILSNSTLILHAKEESRFITN
jgi:hypothetical protein